MNVDDLVPRTVELDRMIAELTEIRNTVGTGTINPGYVWDSKFDYDNLPWLIRTRNFAIKRAVTDMVRELCAGAEHDDQTHIGINFPRGALQNDHKTNDDYGVGGTINGWTIRVRTFLSKRRTPAIGHVIINKTPEYATLSLKNKKVMNFETRYMYGRIGEEWDTDGGVIQVEQFAAFSEIIKEIKTLHSLIKMYKP